MSQKLLILNQSLHVVLLPNVSSLSELYLRLSCKVRVIEEIEYLLYSAHHYVRLKERYLEEHA